MVINFDGMTLKEILEATEKEVIKESLVRNEWNQTKAAADLDVSRKTMRNKIREYGIARQ